MGKLLTWLDRAVDQYHTYMVLLSSKEMFRARAKSAALSLARNAVSLQSQSPLQVIHLTNDGKKIKAVKAAMEEQLIIAGAEQHNNDNKNNNTNDTTNKGIQHNTVSTGDLSETQAVQAAMVSMLSASDDYQKSQEEKEEKQKEEEQK